MKHYFVGDFWHLQYPESRIFAPSSEEPLQRLQSRTWSIIENAKIKDHWSSSWLHKIVNRLCPENLFVKYLPRSYFSLYSTRNSKDLQIPRSRTEFFKKSSHYASLKVWNETPLTTRELPTLNRFKQRLKTHLKG